jgi:hypothetical protein
VVLLYAFVNSALLLWLHCRNKVGNSEGSKLESREKHCECGLHGVVFVWPCFFHLPAVMPKEDPIWQISFLLVFPAQRLSLPAEHKSRGEEIEKFAKPFNWSAWLA